MKRKRKQRELTQWQLDQRAYSAFRQQAYERTYRPSMPWTDPTAEPAEEDDNEAR